jgi:hypothetical protein
MRIGQVNGMIGDLHLDIVYLWGQLSLVAKQETCGGGSVY